MKEAINIISMTAEEDIGIETLAELVGTHEVLSVQKTIDKLIDYAQHYPSPLLKTGTLTLEIMQYLKSTLGSSAIPVLNTVAIKNEELDINKVMDKLKNDSRNPELEYLVAGTLSWLESEGYIADKESTMSMPSLN